MMSLCRNFQLPLFVAALALVGGRAEASMGCLAIRGDYLLVDTSKFCWVNDINRAFAGQLTLCTPSGYVSVNKNTLMVNESR